ncbi:MAG: exosortase, partial [Gammaproteobacteria bacterium]|nr:exosortase [Gammaproteobacteria bacterium]
MNAEQMKKTWRLAGSSIATLLLLTLVLYQQTVLYLTGLWNQLASGEYAHGYLVLAISVYLIFNHKQKLSAFTPCPEYRALLMVMGASMLWMVATLVDVQMLQPVAFLILVLAIVWSVLGNQVIRLLAFPILFIAFAIPIWSPLSPILQNITADAVFGAIRLLSIPALRQDNMIVLPAGTFSIEEACSGLRYLLAALTLGTLYAYMNYSSLRARLIVVLVAASSAVLANILRVFIVVYLGYTTEMQHPLVGDHIALGWYLFAGLVVILLFFDAHLNKVSLTAKSIASDTPHETASTTCKNTPVYYFIFVMSVSLLVSTAPTVVYQVRHHSLNGSAKAVPELPQDTEGWLRTDMANDGWMPVYHGAINQSRLYKKNNDEVIFYVGY